MKSKELLTNLKNSRDLVAPTAHETALMRRNIFQQIKQAPAVISPYIATRAPLWIFRSALATLMIAVGIGSSMAFAAASALPGDTLYGMKLHVNEQVTLFLQPSDAERLDYEIERARARIEEGRKLAERKRLTSAKKEIVVREITEQTERVAQKAREIVFADPIAHGAATDALAEVLTEGEEAFNELAAQEIISEITSEERVLEESAQITDESVLELSDGPNPTVPVDPLTPIVEIATEDTDQNLISSTDDTELATAKEIPEVTTEIMEQKSDLILEIADITEEALAFIEEEQDIAESLQDDNELPEAETTIVSTPQEQADRLVDLLNAALEAHEEKAATTLATEIAVIAEEATKEPVETSDTEANTDEQTKFPTQTADEVINEPTDSSEKENTLSGELITADTLPVEAPIETEGTSD